LGFPPRPGEYKENGSLRDPKQRQGLPYGFTWTTDFDEVDPAKITINVLCSCGGCHTGRVVGDGKVKMIPGGPNTEVEPQMYAKLLRVTAQHFVVKFSPDPAKSIPDPARLTGFYNYLNKLRNEVQSDKLSANYFFGGAMFEKPK